VSSFTVLCSHDGSMFEHHCGSNQDLISHMRCAGAEQIHLVVAWAGQARRGDLIRNGAYAILCTSGKRAINPNVIQSLMNELKS